MKKEVAIVGGGTAGLFLAAFLDSDKYQVTIYEKKASVGRKFLVAGDGGFNLTHVEDISDFKSRYTPSGYMDQVLDYFSNQDLRAWLLALGVPTFVGSSGKIFPEKGIKPIQVLTKLKAHLSLRGVKVKCQYALTEWSENDTLIFNTSEEIKAHYIIFSMGGASWKVTGSDGAWLELFAKNGIQTLPFNSSNCAYNVDWPSNFIQKHEGQPMKNIAFSYANKAQKGEVVITKFGLEGNAIYGLSPKIRAAFESGQAVTVSADLKPSLSDSTIIDKLKGSALNMSSTLKSTLKLSSAMVDLLKMVSTKEEFLDVIKVTKFIKACPIVLLSAAPLDEAISTTGGISLDAVDSFFELKQKAGCFCIGEMLNWDAPTGGYLIQACASMGAYLANELNNRV